MSKSNILDTAVLAYRNKANELEIENQRLRSQIIEKDKLLEEAGEAKKDISAEFQQQIDTLTKERDHLNATIKKWMDNDNEILSTLKQERDELRDKLDLLMSQPTTWVERWNDATDRNKAVCMDCDYAEDKCICSKPLARIEEEHLAADGYQTSSATILSIGALALLGSALSTIADSQSKKKNDITTITRIKPPQEQDEAINNEEKQCLKTV